MKEVFKKLPFAPYEVSNKGNVKSLLKGRLLKPAIQKLPNNKTGYLQVWLRSYDSTRRWHKIHRLVASLFIVNYKPTSYKEVNHKDGNKHNNKANNLEWCNHSQNIKHSYDKNLRDTPKPMKDKQHTKETKELMSKAKQGIKHPKFKGYYLYDNKQFSSCQELADYLNTYPVKINRMVKKGLIQIQPL